MVARDPNGKQIWHTVGNADVLRIDESRESARLIIKRIKAGLPPLESPPVPPEFVQKRCGKLVTASRRQKQTADAARNRAGVARLCVSVLGRPSLHRNPPPRYHRPARSASRMNAAAAWPILSSESCARLPIGFPEEMTTTFAVQRARPASQQRCQAVAHSRR